MENNKPAGWQPENEPERKLVYLLKIDGDEDELWLATGIGDAIEQSWCQYRVETLQRMEADGLVPKLTDAALAEHRGDYEQGIESITLVGSLSDNHVHRRRVIGLWGPQPADILLDVVMPPGMPAQRADETMEEITAHVGFRLKFGGGL